ncbi:glycosyltransferase family 1 protein [Pseudalkalibacillus hwajinpoensis]|uniref:glycosyltransferase family 1 protein n=1 Tax=Guptibacillus hwajinpoensis TaxID=208199 RepID=UPI0038510385
MSVSNKKINVIHVVGSMSRGGAETMIMNLYRNIDRDFVNFSFISHKHEKCSYDDEIESLGGEIHHIDSLGKLGVITYINQLVNLFKNQGPFDSVHIHTNYQAGLVALAARIAGIRQRICHAHSSSWPKKYSIPNNILLYFLKLFIKINSTRMLACSRSAGKFLFDCDNNRKVTIFNNAINVNDYLNLTNEGSLNLRESLNIRKDAILIGHVGRFEKVKNHEFIIDIAKVLKTWSVNYKIVLIGDGPLFSGMKERVEAEGLSDSVLFLGVRSDIPLIMKMIDMFILPSHYEGLPLTVIEAQVAGTRCLISKQVSRECDLDVGLVSFLNINKGAEIWAKEIINKSKKAILDDEERINIIREKGYDAKLNAEKLVEIYTENY